MTTSRSAATWGIASLIAASMLIGCTATAERAGTPRVPRSESTSSVPRVSTTTRVPVTVPACSPWDDGAVSPDAEPVARDLEAHLLDPRLAGNQVSVSVWIDGLGEVVAQNGDLRLPVASNQKLLTAIGVLGALPLNATLRTEVVTAPGSGDLFLVAGGDPTLTAAGPHSLAALAQSVRTAGVTEVHGGLVVDASRYDSARTAPGWLDWQIPDYVGPLSALVVDDNRGRTDPAFLADPALAHGDAFRSALARAGVTVAGPVSAGTAPTSTTIVAGIDSPPIGDLLARMLLLSDNEIAESLTREAGLRLTGTGSTPAGTKALAAQLIEDCAPIAADGWADGSGLSRVDVRSARELRRLVQYAREQPWWPELVRRLPVAGRSGTLAGRFRGTAAEGRVTAKTGTIIGGSSLTGIVTTTSGRTAVFSVVVSGDGSAAAIQALDDLVVALAAL